MFEISNVECKGVMTAMMKNEKGRGESKNKKLIDSLQRGIRRKYT